GRVLLNLHECADLGVVADRAAIQIDQGLVKDLDVFSKLHGISDGHAGSPQLKRIGMCQRARPRPAQNKLRDPQHAVSRSTVSPSLVSWPAPRLTPDAIRERGVEEIYRCVLRITARSRDSSNPQARFGVRDTLERDLGHSLLPIRP